MRKEQRAQGGELADLAAKGSISKGALADILGVRRGSAAPNIRTSTLIGLCFAFGVTPNGMLDLPSDEYGRGYALGYKTAMLDANEALAKLRREAG